MDTNGATTDGAAQRDLVNRLGDPATAEALNRLLDRLDLIAFTFEAADGFLRRSESIVESVAGGVKDLKGLAPAGDGASLAAAIPGLARAGTRLAGVAGSPEFNRLLDSGLLERLSDPATLKSLRRLLDLLPLAEFLLEALDGFLRRSETVVDSVASGMKEVSGLSPPVTLDQVKGLLAGLPQVIEAGLAMIRAGMFEPGVLDVLAETGRMVAKAYQEAKTSPPPPLGLWGLWRALGDPEVQQALGLGAHVARRFGKAVADQKA